MAKPSLKQCTCNSYLPVILLLIGRQDRTPVYFPRTPIKLWPHDWHCFPRMILPVLFLVELLCESRANDASVERGNIDGDERGKGPGLSVGLDHIPEHRLLPPIVHMIRIHSPQPARHLYALKTRRSN